MDKSKLQSPPQYCEYANGQCDQVFDDVQPNNGLFLYPSDPPQIAATIENAVKMLPASGQKGWSTWKDLHTAGQIIYCTICKAMRFSDQAVADVTTLNFNLLFEIGFLLGLELPVIPIRDASYLQDEAAFDQL
jgi:hypothetical protein